MVTDCFGDYIVAKKNNGSKIILTLTLDKRTYDDGDNLVTTSVFDFLSTVKVIKNNGDYPSYDVIYVTTNNGIHNEIIVYFKNKLHAYNFHDFLLNNCFE